MAIRIKTPPQSFVQFTESDLIESCEFDAFSLCLPVLLQNDVAFQFVIETDSSDEADALCASNSGVVVGIARNCQEDYLTTFDSVPEKFRISPQQVLYNWNGGVPGFEGFIKVADCFIIKITVNNLYEFCSNCFQRIDEACHTSVIEYGNDENAFGFNYCATTPVNADEAAICEPLFVTFTNVPVLSIPYTAALKQKYGMLPNVSVWIYDETGELIDAGLVVNFDQYPPTVLTVNMGGPASGVVKISQ